MLNIAVCDDNLAFLDEMNELLQKDTRVEQIELYHDPEKLYEDIALSRKKFDVVFMDIDFQTSKTGIHYAEDLYLIAPDIGIIYVTGYNDRYAQHILLADTNLMGYLTKPVEESLLSRYLDKVCEKQTPQEFLTFSMRRKTYSIPVESILYIESHNHTVTIHTDWKNYVIYEKLSDLLARTPAQIIQCHKSFLVNLTRIRQLEPGKLILQNGQPIPVSKPYMAATQASFFQYIGHKL